MVERHRSAPRAGARGASGVALVLVLAGMLFAANARLAGGADARQPQDLAHLVQDEMDRAETLTTQVQGLRGEVDRLTDAQTTGMPAEDVAQGEQLALAAGRVPVSGPGLTISLSDASATAPRPDWVTNDSLVVHQQDLQAVINALWAGGAEAMTLQGQRVVSTSAFRCVGNVLLLHGRHYSPPYVVQAIGDPQALKRSVVGTPAVQRYFEYVDAVGLGWSLSTESELELPSYVQILELQYASVPAGVEVFGSAATS